MKANLYTTLLLILICTYCNAQYSQYIIQFKDKGSNTYSLNNPSAFLSNKAIARRTTYKIGYDSTDLPVTEQYINIVLAQGSVTLMTRSKWLNQILIRTTDANAIQKINALPFVRTSKAVGLKIAGNTQQNKFQETTGIVQSAKINKQEGDVIDYGNSYAQVHIHNGEFLHNNGYKGEGRTIAVLDGGFFQYKSVTAFDSARNNGQILGEKDLVDLDNSVNEDNTHGMYVLSVLTANWPGKMVGTAPKANYWLIRTENANNEYPVEEHNWVVGAEFADSVGADMISSSLGYNTFDVPAFDHSYNDLYKNTTPVSIGATLAAKKGMIVMNSAGNEGNNSWKYIMFPADADSVCAVGAINVSGQIAGFSSHGYPGKVKPNIVSVGQGTTIASLLNQPASGNGTSFANPNIAGLIACLWQAFPKFNNMQILDAVYRSSDRYKAPDDRYGFGIPDMKKAYEYLKAKELQEQKGNGFWITAYPVPFNNSSTIAFNATTAGKVSLSLIDAAGRIIETIQMNTNSGQAYQVNFTQLPVLPKGVYYVRFDGEQKRTISLLKQ